MHYSEDSAQKSVGSIETKKDVKDSTQLDCEPGVGFNPKVALAMIPVKVRVKGQSKCVVRYA